MSGPAAALSAGIVINTGASSDINSHTSTNADISTDADTSTDADRFVFDNLAAAWARRSTADRARRSTSAADCFVPNADRIRFTDANRIC